MNAIIIKSVEEIPENILCVFGEKFPKGVKYVIGYRMGDEISVYSSQRSRPLENIVTYQPVLNTQGKRIKRK